jgi:hypothetical protein
MFATEMPVSDVWAETEAARAQSTSGRIRQVRLFIVWDAPVVGCFGISRLRVGLTAVGRDHYRSNGSEGAFQARALRREHFSAVFSDVPIVLETDTELARNVNARLVGEAHPGGE